MSGTTNFIVEEGYLYYFFAGVDNKGTVFTGVDSKGTTTLRVDKGTSRDWKYKKYIYWRLTGFGDNGRIYTVTPYIDTLCKIIEDVIVHERKVDMTRKRKFDAPKTIKKLLKSIENGENKEINKEDIKDIYYECAELTDPSVVVDPKKDVNHTKQTLL